MFNIGPLELMVLAIVALIVLGPDRLPQLARDAAQLLRTLRDLATGARQQLKDELGPEFADVDLRNLNPRTAVRNVVFGDDFEFSKLNPRTAFRDAVLGEEGLGSEDLRAADPRTVMRETRDAAMGYEPDTSYAPDPTSDDAAARYDAGFTARSNGRANGYSNGHAPSTGSTGSTGSTQGVPNLIKPVSAPVPPVSAPPTSRPRPRPRPAAPPAASPYDDDAT